MQTRPGWLGEHGMPNGVRIFPGRRVSIPSLSLPNAPYAPDAHTFRANLLNLPPSCPFPGPLPQAPPSPLSPGWQGSVTSLSFEKGTMVVAGGLYTAPALYETPQVLRQISNNLSGSSTAPAWNHSQIYCRVKKDKASILMLRRSGVELLNLETRAGKPVGDWLLRSSPSWQNSLFCAGTKRAVASDQAYFHLCECGGKY